MNKDLQKFFLSKPFAKFMIKMKLKGKNRQLILIPFLEQHTKNKYTKNICLLNKPPIPSKNKQKTNKNQTTKAKHQNQTKPKHHHQQQQKKSNLKLAQLSMKVNIFKKWV